MKSSKYFYLTEVTAHELSFEHPNVLLSNRINVRISINWPRCFRHSAMQVRKSILDQTWIAKRRCEQSYLYMLVFWLNHEKKITITLNLNDFSPIIFKNPWMQFKTGFVFWIMVNTTPLLFAEQRLIKVAKLCLSLLSFAIKLNIFLWV